MRTSQGSIKLIIKADDSTIEVLVKKYAHSCVYWCNIFIINFKFYLAITNV